MDAFKRQFAEIDPDAFDKPSLAEHFFHAGMREAGAMCLAADKSTHPTDLGNAILSEADK